MSINNKEEKTNIDNFKSFVKELNNLELNEINKEKINKIKLILSEIFKYTLKVDIKKFDFFEEFQKILDNLCILLKKKNHDINLCIIEELLFLLSNLKSQEILNYLYSIKFDINDYGTKMNILDIFISISCKNYNRKEEFITTQVNLMKSIVLKLNEKTINYFYDSDINQFPILNKSIFLYDYSEYIVRAAIKNILLLITKIKNKKLICYLTSFPVALYYPIIIYKFKDSISQLNSITLSNKITIYENLEEKHSELFDTILYLNDILLCNINNINFVLINCLLNEIIFPLFNIILSKKEEKISLTNTIYILSLLIFYIKNDFIVNLICFFLFQEKIPLNLFNEIKKYKYKDNNIHFMSDINKLIKNISDADINDINWKRNADFIRKNIGLDLYTGIIEKDNNYHLFKNYLNEKNKKDKDKEINNELFPVIKELFTSKDDSIIINISLLLYNTIYYYYNYFKHYNNNENMSDNQENDEIQGMNKIRNSEISNNNLRNLNKINIKNNNKTTIKTKNDFNIFNNKVIFNPFLLPFFDISEVKVDNGTTLLNLSLKLLKNEKIYRVRTNEIIINIIKFLFQIYIPRKNFSITEMLLQKNKIIIVLKEEITKIKQLIEKIPNLCYYYTLDSYSYYKSEIFETKLKDLMKLYYILVPYNYLEEDEKLPFSLKEDKKRKDIFRNHMINIFLLLDIINLFDENKNNNNNFVNNPFEIEKDVKYYIGKTYKKEEIGKEYAFCFMSSKLEDFKDNVDKIKKGILIITKYNFYLGQIESNTFKDISKIKIIYKVELRFLNIEYPISESDCFIGINDKSNNEENKNIIINCFDSENTRKVLNYLNQMINNCIIFENILFDTFLENIESNL